MIRKPDSLYYSERLRAEREACGKATCEAARAAHAAMADEYAHKLEEAGELVIRQPEAHVKTSR
jgi:hypothetical protein